MTPAQARALLDDVKDKAPRRAARDRPAGREGWTKIRNREDWEAAIHGTPRPEKVA